MGPVLSVARRSRWPAITGSSRPSRSRRSRTVSGGRRRRSRRTSTTRPAKRHVRSRPATRDCAGAAARTPSRATGRATRTRTARAATPVRRTAPEPGGRARRDARVASAVRPAPVVVRLVGTHARRREGEALTRVAETGRRRAWSAASLALGRWPARRLVGTTGKSRQGGRCRRRRRWAATRSRCLNPRNRPQKPLI